MTVGLGTGELRIARGFRAALLGKGALLAGMGVVFAWLSMRVAQSSWPLLARAPAALASAAVALFLLWAAALALLDALQGKAERVQGAVALESRAAGHSLRTPEGKYAEFILWNPWRPLTPGARYTVTIGRFSRVLVSPPELEPPEGSSRPRSPPEGRLDRGQ